MSDANFCVDLVKTEYLELQESVLSKAMNRDIILYRLSAQNNGPLALSQIITFPILTAASPLYTVSLDFMKQYPSQNMCCFYKILWKKNLPINIFFPESCVAEALIPACRYKIIGIEQCKYQDETHNLYTIEPIEILKISFNNNILQHNILSDQLKLSYSNEIFDDFRIMLSDFKIKFIDFFNLWCADTSDGENNYVLFMDKLYDYYKFNIDNIKRALRTFLDGIDSVVNARHAIIVNKDFYSFISSVKKVTSLQRCDLLDKMFEKNDNALYYYFEDDDGDVNGDGDGDGDGDDYNYDPDDPDDPDNQSGGKNDYRKYMKYKNKNKL